jgi:hypothetical protein
MDVFYFILLLIYGILSAILFFKIWRMCNDVHKVMQHLIPQPTTDDNNSSSIDGSAWILVFIIMVSAIGVIFILSIS